MSLSVATCTGASQSGEAGRGLLVHELGRGAIKLLMLSGRENWGFRHATSPS